MKGLCSCLFVVTLVGCTVWKPAPLTPATFTSSDSTSAVRLTMRDGGTVTVRSAQIAGDTLRAERHVGGASSSSWETVQLPLSTIDHAQRHVISAPRTLALFGVITVLGYGMVKAMENLSFGIGGFRSRFRSTNAALDGGSCTSRERTAMQQLDFPFALRSNTLRS